MFRSGILIFLIFLLIVCFDQVSTYKILSIIPFVSPSLTFLSNELMKGLCQAGHDVTVLTVKEDTFPSNYKNCKQILMKDAVENQLDTYQAIIKVRKADKKTPITSFWNFILFADTVMEATLSDSEVQNLLRSNETFDVVVVPHFIFEALKAFAPYFDAHLVLLNIGPPIFWMNHFVGNPTLPSINPEMFLGYTKQMDFFQRCLNTALTLGIYLTRKLYLYPSQAELVHKYISRDIDLEKISYNVSLVLINAHPSVNSASSSVPCMIDIAGYHVKPSKKLPEDLQKFMDEAQYGVIYFSLGSNVHISDWDVVKYFVKTFSKRKELVLWKFHATNLSGLSDNVKVAKWFPQTDILAHPNTKLFITHGGFLSTIETIHYGLPTVAIPISGDQILNTRFTADMGFTKIIEFPTITEDKITEALEEVLGNQTYAENAKMRSKIFHDRPMKPLDTAIYWIEYVARHNGAKHLRVNYLELNWFQFYLLDVYGFFGCIIFVLILVIKNLMYRLIEYIFKIGYSTKSKKQ
ncbi:UDP-glycosyltransferase UGT5-like [Diorhabda carinulata]|uniref:UDP-glycosyltransferase UGT5-like n=1 Tax=Diorhabda carinulata TaxID=1163345 RepID=UPI0025A292EA|nr:UDP-glycosyltransferase UGT5-like [Diorhabda carinulata]